MAGPVRVSGVPLLSRAAFAPLWASKFSESRPFPVEVTPLFRLAVNVAPARLPASVKPPK